MSKTTHEDWIDVPTSELKHKLRHYQKQMINKIDTDKCYYKIKILKTELACRNVDESQIVEG